MKYVIEHMDKRLYKWCFIEYRHISKVVGKSNLIFTNVRGEKSQEKLRTLGKVYEESVKALGLKNACVLDPSAKKTLSSKDTKRYTYLIFGGVLGEHPPKKRTEKELTSVLGFDSRNLGHEQMSTDTAVYVAKLIEKSENIGSIDFVDEIEIELRKGESVVLPYRYVKEKNKVVLPDGFIRMLKERREF